MESHPSFKKQSSVQNLPSDQVQQTDTDATNHKRKPQTLHIVIGVLVFLILCVGGYSLVKWYMGEESIPTGVILPIENDEEDDEDGELNSDTETDIDTDENGEMASSISGQVGFPAGVRPELEVCAVNVNEDVTYCVTVPANQCDEGGCPEGVNPESGEYKLEVIPGSYHVYAMISEETLFSDEAIAYYTDFVACGQNVNSCTSHEYIDVEVGAGEDVDSIDPVDWFNL